MQREKPFVYIDTNFSPGEQLMLKLAFSSFDFEIVGISTISSYMDSLSAAENIVGLNEKEELYLSVVKGEEKNLSDQDIIIKGENEKIFENFSDYPEDMDATSHLIQIAEDCGKLDILATGPLTNIAKALREAPELEDYISHIFILGSTFSRGDVTNFSEFNFFTDPIAADEILNSSIECFILPLELSKSIILSDDLIKELEGKDENLDIILKTYKNLDEDLREVGPALLLYLLQVPQAFIFEEEGLKVNLKLERGKVERVNSRKKAYIANRVNEESFFDYLKGNLG
jgi:inosine-uridine nucleoside N-ribohydrolase